MVSAGLAESREKARKLILAGAVFVDGRVAEKASKEIIGEMTVMLTRKERFVGRGGEKLAAALALFKIDPTGLRALDIGASTGGFTDCLLQSGASFVVALDAGKGQLHPRLCADARVRSVEKYNARNLSPADVGTFDLVVMDVSFISQTLILPRLSALLLPGGRVVSLIKPQFELNKNALGKNGIVRDEKIFMRPFPVCFPVPPPPGLPAMRSLPLRFWAVTETGSFLRSFAPAPAGNLRRMN